MRFTCATGAAPLGRQRLLAACFHLLMVVGEDLTGNSVRPTKRRFQSTTFRWLSPKVPKLLKCGQDPVAQPLRRATLFSG